MPNTDFLDALGVEELHALADDLLLTEAKYKRMCAKYGVEE